MNTLSIAQSRIGLTLPKDLIEYIWQFNYNYAVNIINKYTKKFIYNKVSVLTSMIHSAGSHYQLGYAAKNYLLFYNNRLLSNKNILTTLNACKCCDRHQINKPCTLSKYISSDEPLNQNTICICACRHTARFICREID